MLIKKIEAKLTVLLSSLVLLTLVLGGVALYAFGAFLTVTERFLSEELPHMETVDQVATLSQSLTSAAPKLLQTRDAAALAATYRIYQDNLNQLGKITSEVSAFQSSQQILDLNFHSQSLRSNLNVLIRLKLQLIELEQQVEAMLSRLADQVESLQWRDDTREHDRLTLEIHSLAHDLFRNNLRAKAQTEQRLGAHIARYEQLYAIPDDPLYQVLHTQNPLLLKARITRLQQLIKDPEQRVETSTDALVAATQAMVTDIRQGVVAEISNVRRQGEQGQENIIALTLLGVVAALAIGWLLIFRNLGRRLSLLSGAMRLPDPYTPASRVPVEGDDEIAAMARTLEALLEHSRQLAITREELAKALDRAESASAAKSAFLANMSHELRTPLNAILGYADLLKRNAPATSGNALDTISQSGEHLLSLINDLLDLSKIEAEKLELHPAPLQLPGFLSAIGDMIRLRCRQRGVQFDIELDPQLPTTVELDQIRLRQVLLNLLSNAVKFTDHGCITLSVQCLDGDREQLRFEVRDTGVGIPAEELELIFDPFEQVGDFDRRRGGTGLGLAICRRLVELMGGNLQVDSAPDSGSRFHFSLPAPEIQDDTGATAASATTADDRLEPPPSSVGCLRGMTLEEAEQLYRLARIGNMKALRDEAERLASIHEAFAPLADQVLELAHHYQSRALLQLIRSAIQEEFRDAAFLE